MAVSTYIERMNTIAMLDLHGANGVQSWVSPWSFLDDSPRDWRRMQAAMRGSCDFRLSYGCRAEFFCADSLLNGLVRYRVIRYFLHV